MSSESWFGGVFVSAEANSEQDSLWMAGEDARLQVGMSNMEHDSLGLTKWRLGNMYEKMSRCVDGSAFSSLFVIAEG